MLCSHMMSRSFRSGTSRLLGSGPGPLPPAALPLREGLGGEGRQRLPAASPNSAFPPCVCGALGSSARLSVSTLRELPAALPGSPQARVVFLPCSGPAPAPTLCPGAVRWAS